MENAWMKYLLELLSNTQLFLVCFEVFNDFQLHKITLTDFIIHSFSKSYIPMMDEAIILSRKLLLVAASAQEKNVL